ncbi:MAG: tetratricopeptide repeat protein [Weeksellaceae bacterium]|nr:tetratricopeptide repeat protein [Weeksellaceae bacterium]
MMREILKNPLANHSDKLFTLEESVKEYPFFQAGWAILCRNLGEENSEIPSKILEQTAIRTAEREQLYRFVHYTSPTTPEQESVGKKSPSTHQVQIEKSNTPVAYHAPEPPVIESKPVEEEVAIPTHEQKTEKIETSSDESQNLAPQESNANLEDTSGNQTIAQSDIPKQQSSQESEDEETPTSSATRSFTDWLHKSDSKLESKTKEDAKDKETKVEESSETSEKLLNDPVQEDTEVLGKFKIIEEFLEKNPKITPVREYRPTASNPNVQAGMTHLMTETLANIYLEQKKYDKAIKAFTILRLKYPEKSGYFADRIKEIKELQNNI